MVDRAARYGLLTEIPTLKGPSTPTSLPKLEKAIQRLQNGLLSAREMIKSFFWNLQIKGLWGMWSNREKKISIHREPRELIKSAMRKLRKGRPITVREAQGLNVLWHEIGHSQGSQSMPGYSYELNNPMTFAVEIVNEMHARLTLDRFIRQLGFDPRLVPTNDVLNAPGSYHQYTPGLGDLLFVDLNVSKEEAIAFFEWLNYTREPTTYINELARFIGGKPGLSATDISQLEGLIVEEIKKTGDADRVRRKIRQRF